MVRLQATLYSFTIYNILLARSLDICQAPVKENTQIRVEDMKIPEV
jgi:hypothetical protein